MTFLRYLAYEKSYIYLYLVGFLIAAAVLLTDSNGGISWGTFFYAFILSLVVLLGYIIIRYQQNVRVIRQMKSEDYESLSLEGEFAQQHIEELRKQHIHEMNRVQERQREHYDFIVSWFHEIKTPIAVLRLLQQTDMDANSLREEIAKIENYVDQALYYAKLDSFNQDYAIQHSDVIQISKEIVKAHAKTFFSKKIRIHLQAETLVVQSDPKWLLFIVNQLVTNSLKYTENGGEITISTCETPQEKQLFIRDNGIGISQQDLPRIFNRGFTGETGRTFALSTGMGLYLAQQLSNKLGHYITCTSEVGVYTQCILHFPKDEDPYINVQQKTQ
ncbi:sensor histidine kinase [Paenibacillus qinlingensis]|uniref:sensor histidine kinase n=1 Tax=Paenibacillus qinlingensis TaxID=1837343 RepID=UPI00156529C2|nr:sensor histidine kinase [Paenibacillus qinlingensis]NQX61415.1 sensor histidine kinase [Paenibacillus qinlingensis]